LGEEVPKSGASILEDIEKTRAVQNAISECPSRGAVVLADELCKGPGLCRRSNHRVGKVEPKIAIRPPFLTKKLGSGPDSTANVIEPKTGRNMMKTGQHRSPVGWIGIREFTPIQRKLFLGETFVLPRLSHLLSLRLFL
jgi:hypothetical protein